ncbi:hypothetical protein MDAP_002612 [Mitosporidium daphniae]
MEHEKLDLSAMISSLLHVPERIAFYSDLEKRGCFPSTWLSFVRDIIPSRSHAFDNLVLKEPLNLNSILHSETLSDPGRYIPNLGKSIARLSSLLEQRSQPLPGLDQYALPKASSPVARNNAKPMLFQPKDTPASKKQKTEKHTPSNGPLKIVLKFYLLICTDWSSYRDRATHLN